MKLLVAVEINSNRVVVLKAFPNGLLHDYHNQDQLHEELSMWEFMGKHETKEADVESGLYICDYIVQGTESFNGETTEYDVETWYENFKPYTIWFHLFDLKRVVLKFLRDCKILTNDPKPKVIDFKWE